MGRIYAMLRILLCSQIAGANKFIKHAGIVCTGGSYFLEEQHVTLEACEVACEIQGRCEAFSFYSADGICLLFKFCVFENISGFDTYLRSPKAAMESTEALITDTTNATTTKVLTREDTTNATTIEVLTSEYTTNASPTEVLTAKDTILAPTVEVLTTKDTINAPTTEVLTAEDTTNASTTEVLTAEDTIIAPTVEVLTTKDTINAPTTEVLTAEDTSNAPTIEFLTAEDTTNAQTTEVLTAEDTITAPITEVLTAEDTITAPTTEVLTAVIFQVKTWLQCGMTCQQDLDYHCISFTYNHVTFECVIQRRQQTPTDTCQSQVIASSCVKSKVNPQVYICICE